MSVTVQRRDQTVVFEQDTTDQSLLEAISRELAQQRFSSFSDLCKQALRQFLLNTELTQSAALFVQLERQIVELQFKLAEVERKAALSQGNSQSHRLDELACQVQQLMERLAPPKPDPVIPALQNPPPPPRKLDPLLSRLGPLLEDF